MDFKDALNTVTAELTPQPWEHTASDGTTLTVIPAGLPDAPGMAEVLVRTTPPGTDPIEAGIITSDMPVMIDALTGNRLWCHETLVGMWCDLTPFGGGGM